MSQNNNSQYGYNNRNPYESSHNNNNYGLMPTNTYPYQSQQQLPATSLPSLLPYHEYMAMKGKINTPVQQPNIQPLPQQYPVAAQPYHYQSSMYHQQGYTPLPVPAFVQSSVPSFSPSPAPYSYTPLQPYSAYMQQKQQQMNHNFQGQVQSSHAQNQVQLFASSQSINPNASSSSIKETQRPQARHSPSPMKNMQVLHKQPQPKTSPYKNHQQKRPNLRQNTSPNPKQQYQKQQPQRSYNNSTNYRQSNYELKHRIRQQEDDYNMNMSSDGWSQQQQEQQMLYQKYESRKYLGNNNNNKSKPIQKKRDTINDDPEQVKKWIQARKRNYPGLRKRLNKQLNPVGNEQNDEMQQQRQKEKREMSKLQSKIRKKLTIVNGDNRSIMKKIKNIQILRRIVQDPRILTRERKPRPSHYNSSQSNHYGGERQRLVRQVEKKDQIVEEIVQNELKLIGQEGQLGQVVEDKIVEEIMPQQLIVERQNDLSSDSQESVEPQELPANKIPTQQHVQVPNILVENKQKPSQLFQFVSNPSKPSPILASPIQNPRTNKAQQKFTKRQPKSLDPQTIIAHLKQKQRQDKQSMNSLFDYKSNSHSYNYRVQTLQTSLKLDQIFAQTTYLLQAIRYIAKENFFDQPSTIPEKI